VKITKSQLKQIIKEELLKEYGGSIANFGGMASSLGAVAGRNEPPSMENEPDSIVQEKAAQFFANLEITEKVVGILVNNIAIPDLITIMEKVPKIDTAEEELHEVYSDKQRSWACAQDEEKFKEMCRGPMKKKKGKK
jgi:hypothetical protein